MGMFLFTHLGRYRTRLAAVVLLLAPALAPGQFLPPGIAMSETQRIADGLYTFRWGAYRSLFMVTPAGVIATDPVSPEAAVGLRWPLDR